MDGLAFNKTSKAVLEYWLSLPRPEGKLCPYRTDFRMMDISEHAGEVFLDERHSDDVLCVVQSGDQLNKTLGVDLTGHNLMLLLPEDEFPLEREYFRALHETPCAGYITRIAADVRGREFIYRATHLPLLGANGNVRFFVGTGTALEGKSASSDVSHTNFGRLQLLEREFFDIGAGLPEIKVAEPNYS